MVIQHDRVRDEANRILIIIYDGLRNTGHILQNHHFWYEAFAFRFFSRTMSRISAPEFTSLSMCSHYHVSINMTQVIIMLRVMSQIFMSKKKVIVGNTDSLNCISYGGTTFLGSMKIIRL